MRYSVKSRQFLKIINLDHRGRSLPQGPEIYRHHAPSPLWEEVGNSTRLTLYLTVPGHLCPAFQLPVEVMGVDWPGKDISTLYVLVRLAEGCYECMKSHYMN